MAAKVSPHLKVGNGRLPPRVHQALRGPAAAASIVTALLAHLRRCCDLSQQRGQFLLTGNPGGDALRSLRPLHKRLDGEVHSPLAPRPSG